MDSQPHERFRRDGWTPARQLRFLDALARTRSVTRAAAAAGMSRESAYRLRSRPSSGLFAAAWDRALLGHKLVNIDRARRHFGNAGFPPKSNEGHKVDGPPISRIPSSTL